MEERQFLSSPKIGYRESLLLSETWGKGFGKYYRWLHWPQKQQTSSHTHHMRYWTSHIHNSAMIHSTNKQSLNSLNKLKAFCYLISFLTILGQGTGLQQFSTKSFSASTSQPITIIKCQEIPQTCNPGTMGGGIAQRRLKRWKERLDTICKKGGGRKQKLHSKQYIWKQK